LSLLIHVTVSPTLTLTGFGENALSSNSDAPDTIETWWVAGGLLSDGVVGSKLPVPDCEVDGCSPCGGDMNGIDEEAASDGVKNDGSELAILGGGGCTTLPPITSMWPATIPAGKSNANVLV
jgi:hypothetical protein